MNLRCRTSQGLHRWCGVVLNVSPHLTCPICTSESDDQMQGHVDAG